MTVSCPRTVPPPRRTCCATSGSGSARLGDSRATAIAELVRYERRPATLLGFIQASELVPVPLEPILTFQLQTAPAALGAVRWTIVNAEAG